MNLVYQMHRFFDTPGIRLKIREQHSSLNVRNLYKYELEFLRSLRHDKNFNDIFRGDAIWSLRGFGRPIITEIFTNQDKYKLLCSGPTYGRESVFSINYRLFYNSGLLFKTKISDIFDNVRIIEALSNYNITTIGTLVYYFNSTIAKQMYTNDVIALLKFLKRNGFIASNDFYRSCIDNSITESVCKKKFSKRVIHEVRFVETKRPEKHASIRKTPAEIELHKILESKGDKITRKRRQLERDRYYRNLLMERGYTDTLDSDRIDYRKNKTTEYIISFNKNTTLNDVQEYFSSPPEYIGQEYMSSIGIYCDLEHYDQ